MGWGKDSKPSGPGEVFFEFTQLGPQMRVAAIDGATGIEVVVIAPLSATQSYMQTLALAKLKRRLESQG
ncbi:MAG: serine hydroxymethyltransferase [Devosia sp.]